MKLDETSLRYQRTRGVRGLLSGASVAKLRVSSGALAILTGLLFIAIVASTLQTASSAASHKGVLKNDTQSLAPAHPNDLQIKSLSTPFGTIPRWSPLLTPPMPAGDALIATYEVVSGACTNNPKDSFALGEQVCVKVTNGPLGPGFAIAAITVAGTDGTVADLVEVNTDPQELIFTLPSTTTSVVNGEIVDNRGSWRATVNGRFDFETQALAYFSVTDPNNAAADLVIFNNSTATGFIEPGSATGFSIYVTNQGPDSAAAVHVTQSVPSNMTFDSATPESGASFTCAASNGVVDCTPAGGSLAKGAFSLFTLNYTVSAGAPNAILTTEADITSTTTDPFPASNASSTRIEIRDVGSSPPTCILACPLNMTVAATTSQNNVSGAIVNFAPEANGDCGSVTSTPASGSFFPVGNHTVSSSSSAGGGTCTFTVTVVETAAPTITCAADQNATTSGSALETSVTVNPPNVTGTNVVLDGVRSDNRSLSDPYPIGTTTITWSARECNDAPDCNDPTGRSASCTQKIIVTSPDAPTISCPSNKSFSGDCGSGATLTAAQIGSPTATGSNVTVTGQRSDNSDLYNDPYPIGTTTITWTASDDIGRQVSCTHVITITSANDTENPTITAPPNVTVSTNSCGQIVGESELGTPTANDDCGTPNISRTGVPAGNFFPTGTTTITYTATDGAGNTATATQTVTVTESINPTITAPSDLTLNTGPGATSCGLVIGDATLGTAAANDNCPGVVTTRSGVPAGNNFPVGTTTITYTATDRSGNTATDQQIITVVDNTPPTISAPADANYQCASNVPAANAGDATASDNCGTANVTVSESNNGGAGSIASPLIITRTYTATDPAGNSASDSQTITVIDNTPPVISCPANITVYLPLNSTDTSMPVTYPAPTATDNCGGTATITTTIASGSVFPVGTTPVTATATDDKGNSSSCTFTITVLYNFTGFFAPVDNPPTLNVVNAGRAIPVKFSLSGNKGLDIFAVNSPYTIAINCDGSAPQSDVEETLTAGSSSLSYDPTTDRYNYIWKTENSWAGTCRQLVVKLNDGSEHRANFKFR